jgi:hypothetical protein
LQQKNTKDKLKPYDFACPWRFFYSFLYLILFPF